MERTPLHLAYINAFYYPLNKKDIPPYQGCIRVTISNYIHSEAAPTRTIPHHLFRPIYFCFSLQRKSPDSFALEEKALWAENKAPLYSDRKEWSISELPRPCKASDRKLLEILIRQLQDSAASFLHKCKSHRGYSLRQRRSFLSHFAPPLREKLEGKAWYGTIHSESIELKVREGDFETCYEKKHTALPEIRLQHDPWGVLI